MIYEKMELIVSFSFKASHSVKIYGVREETHRHRFLCEVILEGEPNEYGIVEDFIKVDKIVKDMIVQRFHNKNLNEFIENPTAEELAKEIYKILKPYFEAQNYRLKAIRVYESPRFSVYYQP